MFLKSKEIAYTGILMALGVILVTLGGYIEGSTLFFLAAASFLAGIVERNFSIVAAIAFLIGTSLLSFILAPQKLYCATFAAFCVYIIVAEFLENISVRSKRKVNAGMVWGLKAVVYHGLLGISLFLIEKVFGFEEFFRRGDFYFLKNHTFLFWLVIILCAEILWIVFDRAYIYFQRRYGHYFKG